MQQRQPRLGDILDDYCPRERRVTNHAVVAMLGDAVKQTRCTTCEADHEYKHAKVPRQRRKSETPAALYSQVLANAPKRVTHGAAPNGSNGSNGAHGADAAHSHDTAHEEGNREMDDIVVDDDTPVSATPADARASEAPAPVQDDTEDQDADEGRDGEEDGPVHRPLIRASLPRSEGQQPPARPIPEFTIRQPGGRPNRFRPRGGGQQRGPMGGGGQQFQGNRSGGSGGNTQGGPPRGMRSNGGRPPRGPQGGVPSGMPRRNGPGRKRSK